MKAWFQSFNNVRPTLLPLAFGYVASGITYGILMRTQGHGILSIALISGLVYAGSLQYAAIPMYAGHFDPLSVFVLTIFINFRHIFYGISMLEPYRGMGLAKPFLIYTLSDEVFSINYTIKTMDQGDRKRSYLINAAFLYTTWILMTLIGGVIGSAFHFNTQGIDFAMTALFICMTTGLWKTRTNQRSILIGMALSLICLLIFGPDAFLIPALLLIFFAFYFIWRKDQ